jgi:hypothetical protein
MPAGCGREPALWPRLSGLGLDKLGIEIGPGMALPVDANCRVATAPPSGRGRRKHTGRV